jgi:hypothetical protein
MAPKKAPAFPPTNYHADEVRKNLLGKKVTLVRALTGEELEDLCWGRYEADQAIVIVFDDGTMVLPMQDPEGNGAGFLEIQSA